MSIDIGNDLRGDIKQVRGNPEHAVTRRASGASLATATLGVRFALDQNHAHLVIRSLISFATRSKVHDHVAKDLDLGGWIRRA